MLVPESITLLVSTKGRNTTPSDLTLVVGSTIFVAGTLALYAGLGLAYQKEKTSRNISTGLIVLAGLITFTVVFLVLKAIADPIV